MARAPPPLVVVDSNLREAKEKGYLKAGGIAGDKAIRKHIRQHGTLATHHGTLAYVHPLPHTRLSSNHGLAIKPAQFSSEPADTCLRTGPVQLGLQMTL